MTMSTQPETIGPYRILDRIGKGGMGIVYRGEHPDTGKRVAIKTLTELSESLLAGFRREIHALALINHPGIVRVLEKGVQDDGPWYAMEYIEGPTLREFVRKTVTDHMQTMPMADADTADRQTAQTGQMPNAEACPVGSEDVVHGRRPEMAPEVLSVVLGVMQSICSSLAFLHGEGIVHRDLKPDNILIQPSGQPVLVDFGVASFFAATDSREALGAIESGWGTVSYMAPEQIGGYLVDARADLYAFGCILYELITGKPPFSGGRYLAIAQAHLNQTPVRPSQLVESVPDELDTLIMRLLEKRPRNRLGYAADIAAALARLGATPLTPAPGRKPRPYLYRPGLVGRDTVLERVQSLVGNLDLKKGGMMLVGGESGVGKTRLVMEIGREWGESHTRVLTGECTPEPKSGTARLTKRPLAPLRRTLRAIADLCIENGRVETQRLLGKRLKVLAAFEPDLLTLDGAEDVPVPPELPAEAARLRVFECLAETFAALASMSPVLLILDDLQWADELTIGFLRYLIHAETTASIPLFVLGAYRSEEITDEFRPLTESSAITQVFLDRLSPDAVAAVIGEMLALDVVPPSLADFIAAESEGNPFFIAEYLRAAVDEGLLRRDAEGTWRFVSEVDGREGAIDEFCLELPSSLRDLIERRLRRMPPHSTAVMAAAAVVGREAAVELLGRMSGLNEPQVARAVTDLLRRQVFEEGKRGTVRFTHDQIRELAYDNLSESARSTLHRAAAEHLPSITPRTPPSVLGRHWEAGGDNEKARACYLTGARRARSQHAYAEAERLYQAYLSLATSPTAESVEARNELGYDILRAGGRGLEAVALHELSLHEARQLGNRKLEASSLRALGAVCKEIGRVDASREHFDRALTIAREIGDRQLQGVVLSGLCLLDTEQGRFDQARTAYEEAIDIARELGDDDLHGRILTNLAFLRSDQGHTEEAIDLCGQALALARNVGNRRMEGIAINNLAVMSYRVNRYEEAVALYRVALDIHREVGNRRFEGVTLVNLAVMLSSVKQYDEAIALYRQALVVLRQVGDRRTEGIVMTNLGFVQAQRGFISDAGAYFDRALLIHQDVENRRMEAITYGYLASIERRAGHLNVAERLLTRALALLEHVGDAIFTAVFECERGHLELAHGRPARHILEDVQSRAVRLSPVDNDLTEAIERLHRAVRAQEASTALAQGEASEDVPQQSDDRQLEPSSDDPKPSD